VGIIARIKREGEEAEMGLLTGKVAIVTGATSGIGERIAEVFVEEGANVVVAARRASEGRNLERRLGATFIETDVAKETDVKAMVDQTLERFGRLDCLVNNAGQPSPIVSIAEVDVETIDRIFAVNVRGVFLGIKHAAPAMISSGSGSIINIGSIAALRGGVSGHVYSAAKGAVQALTRSAAAELGEKGVRVNNISPGAIVTGIFAKNAGVEGAAADKLTEGLKQGFAKLQPIPRAGLPDDIARAAAYFASDASSFVTGQDIVVDGGQTTVTRGWTEMFNGRAEMSKRLRAAAAAFQNSA
jgi:NAD(P)-dependent dehydrogenase (short-subunit alcohol dehydrogenase family)